METTPIETVAPNPVRSQIPVNAALSDRGILQNWEITYLWVVVVVVDFGADSTPCRYSNLHRGGRQQRRIALGYSVLSVRLQGAKV